MALMTIVRKEPIGISRCLHVYYVRAHRIPDIHLFPGRKAWAGCPAELVSCVVFIWIFFFFPCFSLVDVDQPFSLMTHLPNMEDIGDGRHQANACNYFHNTFEMLAYNYE